MCAAAVLAVVVARMRAKLRTWFSSSCFHLDSYAEICCLPYALYSSLVNWVDMPPVWENTSGENFWWLLRISLASVPLCFSVHVVVYYKDESECNAQMDAHAQRPLLSIPCNRVLNKQEYNRCGC